MDRMKQTLKLFVHTLVKEEVRDCFIGREAFYILKNQPSSLVKNLNLILDSFTHGGCYTLKINGWIQMSLNQLSDRDLIE